MVTVAIPPKHAIVEAVAMTVIAEGWDKKTEVVAVHPPASVTDYV
jgi:hypothetical protein